jgi:putative DNA primase/helicase
VTAVAVRPVERRHADLLVSLSVNGKAKCRATIARVLPDGSEEILARDAINPDLSRDRKPFVDSIEEATAEEKVSLSNMLIECADEIDEIRQEAKRALAAAPDADLPAEYSDDAIALSFARRHGSKLRYTATWSKWHEWDGTRWAEDSTLGVFEKVRVLCRDIAAHADETPAAKAKIRSAQKVASVERLARADRIHAARPEQWDKNQFSIGTPAGTVDLTTGSLVAAKPEDYITKQTAVAPGSGKCSRWLAFLDWATGGDSKLLAFLQRMAGYMLTGSIREHALFFPYGIGGNGKSTMVDTLTGIMGEYATVAPMEAFTEAKGERHPTDLAMLRGARLVASHETERGRKWAENRVKHLTGGGRISARFMRQDFFTYQPEFKLLIAGNEKPAIASVDEAIRRRFHLIPFEQQITPEKRDENLPEKLRDEWPAIFAWMIEGCQLWLESGLCPPDRVQAATQAYLEEQDSFGSWLEEACRIGPREWASTAELYESWVTWARRSGEEAGSKKAFGSEMSKRGFTPKLNSSGTARGYAGIAVKQDTLNAYQQRAL